MNRATPPFFVTSGTLFREALSYVRREADDELYEALSAGEFCYVLTPRQMGKSSLMAHTAKRLQDAQAAVAVLDLSAIGSDLNAAQWYHGLLDQLGSRLHLEDELDDFLYDHPDLSPLQQWQRALREVALGQQSKPVVIFLDEIDMVRSLPFSTDEFFAAIRACYHARAEDAAYQRLTFCLLGVATPADLIRNPKLTPFNIGRRIDLHDFTEEEAGQLRFGLRAEQQAGTALMQRITYWTGGHPCLTQRLCKLVAEDITALTPSDVDRCCRHLFLASSADNQDDNLLFVQKRLLPEAEEERAALLTLYRQVLDGKQVRDNETTALVSELKLSGVVRVHAGKLQVRNRIYHQVFNKTWIGDHLPDAERRRQRTAFRRGAMRTVSIAGALLLCMAGLTLTAVLQRQQALRAEAETKRLLYAADMYVLDKEWEAYHDGRAVQLLDAQSPHKDEPDLRGWEWRYMWQRAHRESLTLRGHKGIIFGVDYSPDGRLLATAGIDKTVRLWDAHTGAQLGLMTGHTNTVLAVKFSPDGRLLASCGEDNTLRLWDVRTQQQIGKTMVGWYCVAFSPDGRTVAASANGNHAPVRLWNVATQQPVLSLPQVAEVFALAFSPNGKTLATGGNEFISSKQWITRLWDLNASSRLPSSRQLVGHTSSIDSMAFSRNGRLLATGGDEATVELWDVQTHRRLYTLKGHHGPVSSIKFSPDDKTLATGSWDQTTRLWDVQTGKTLTTLRGQPDMVTSVAFSPDGKRLATASKLEVRVWDLPVRPQTWKIYMKLPPFASLAMAPDEQSLAIHDVSTDSLFWQYPSGKKLPTPPIPTRDVQGNSLVYQFLAFSPNGALFATARENAIDLWDRRTWQKTRTFRGSLFGTLAFSPDSSQLVTADLAKNEIILWDVRTGYRISHWQAHKNAVLAMAFSPDGKWLVSGSWDRTLQVWDMKSGHSIPPLVQTLHGHENSVRAVAFSPDGKTLLTTGDDKIIKCWQVPTFREMMSLPAPSRILTLHFLKDGNTLLAGGVNGDVYVWQASSLQEIQARTAQK